MKKEDVKELKVKIEELLRKRYLDYVASCQRHERTPLDYEAWLESLSKWLEEANEG